MCMRASIDSDGRILLPPDLRDAVGLKPGDEIDVRVREGILEVAPIELPVRLERRKYLLVAVPEIPVEPMTTDQVNAARDALLSDRLSRF
jgi:AbrB family looped-hinge helix DNA binding protein